ncbi:MerR family transcriptional regulator, partial [Nocardia takedensis]
TRLRRITDLTAAGINLTAITRILDLEDDNAQLRAANTDLEDHNTELRADNAQLRASPPPPGPAA